VKLNYKQIGTLLVAIILTASGTIYLEKTGEYVNCRGLWNENDDGSFTCPKNNVTQYCYEVENRGSGWYRCWIGIPIEIDDAKEVISKTNKGRWICDPSGCEQE